MTAPIVILVRPQMGENIGAVARAMSNFGLSELRIVAPRDGWPNSKAWEMAAGGKPIIEAAKIYPDFVGAMHDIQLAYATTARPRDMEKRVVTPSEAMAEILQMTEVGLQMTRKEADPDTCHPSYDLRHPRVALVFGPERTGLENEEITWCDTIITIPTSPENFSLNLGQSSVILGYEWWKQRSDNRLQMTKNKADADTCHPSSELYHLTAPISDWEGMFGQLEQYLDESGFFRVAAKKSLMWQNIRTMLLRGRFTEQEVRTFRGMLRVMWEGRVARK